MITGPENLAAKDTPLRTEHARQVFQKLHPRITTKLKHLFLTWTVEIKFLTHRRHVTNPVVRIRIPGSLSVIDVHGRPVTIQ